MPYFQQRYHSVADILGAFREMTFDIWPLTCEAVTLNSKNIHCTSIHIEMTRLKFTMCEQNHYSVNHFGNVAYIMSFMEKIQSFICTFRQLNKLNILCIVCFRCCNPYQKTHVGVTRMRNRSGKCWLTRGDDEGNLSSHSCGNIRSYVNIMQ